MRYIRYAVLAAIAVALITVALANRASVTLNLLPRELADLTGYSFSVTLPLFLVIFAGIVAGLLIGFVWEWMREHKHRAAASSGRRENKKLQREVSRLKDSGSQTPADEVLALLEDTGRTR
jgi:uncharacterized integral membrane protein